MKITNTDIHKLFIIELQSIHDDRGSFTRSFCNKVLSEHHLDFEIKQCNISHNIHAKTIRGLHYQKEPYPEIKLVSCTKGEIYDVVVDIRKDSPTYLKQFSIILNENSNKLIYIPPFVAHGFQTLTDNTVVYYQLGEFFIPDYYDGIRFNDSIFNIDWPFSEGITISNKDANYKNFKP